MTAVRKQQLKKHLIKSDVDMFEPSLQFSSIMSTDEVIQITLLWYETEAYID